MPEVTADSSRTLLCATLITALAIGAVACAHAQEADASHYPSRPIHIIVPFPAGGPTDILTRIVAQEMRASWGQPVVIENRPGADTAIGAEIAAKADPDGYTLFAAMDSTMVLNPLLKKDLPYDPAKDFAPVSLGAKNISLVEVRADSPAHNVRDLLTALKAKPGTLNFGAGTTNGRLAGLMFAKLTGTAFAIIPYKGSTETVQGLLTGSVDFVVDGVASSYPLIQSGKLRALAKLNDRPFARMPDLPSLAEAADAPDLGDISNWIAFYAPAGTSPEIVGKLSSFIATIYADPIVAKRLDDAGIVAMASTPAELDGFARHETERWGKVIRDNAKLFSE